MKSIILQYKGPVLMAACLLITMTLILTGSRLKQQSALSNSNSSVLVNLQCFSTI